MPRIVMVRYGPAVLRIAVGAVFIAHGAQKLLPVWAGAGVLVAILELGAGAMLIAGALTRVAAVALLVELAAAVWKVEWLAPPGRGDDYEFNLLLMAALLCLILSGPGAFSVDGRRARDAEWEAAGRARLRAGRI